MRIVRTSLTFIFIFVLGFAPLSFAQDTSPSEQVFDLGDVLVLEKSGDVNQATTTNIISIEDIEQTGASSAAEALEYVTGIDIAVHPKTGPALKMRGFDQEDIKILIDGVPAHVAYDGSLDLGQIPVDSIAKIEVTKGASSVLYGANTMGGIINIVTKKGAREPVTKVTTSFGENNTRNVIFNHGGAKGKFNYWVSYSFRDSDGWDVSDDFDPANSVSGIGTEYNEDGGTRDLSYYTYKTLNTKIGYEYDNNSKLYLSFDYHENERGCPGFDNRYWAFDEWNQWHLNLVGEHDVTDKITVKARVFYVDHEDTLEDVSWDADHTTSKKWFEQSSYDDYSVGGDFQTYINLTEKNLLKVGATYIRDHHQSQDYLDADSLSVVNFGDPVGYAPEETYEADTYSLAVEDELMLLKDKLTLIGGISYDVNSPKQAHDQPVPDDIDSFNPQVGVVYQASDSLKLHASVAKKTRFPKLKELYSEMAGGNADLNPQKTIAYELGVTKRFNRNLSLSSAVFYNDLEDKITREKVSGDWAYVNKGEATLKGIEAQIDYITDFDLKIGAGYTYLSSRDKADASSPEKDAEYTPEHKLTLDVRYVFDFGLSAALQCIYTGEQIEYDDSDNKVTLDNFTVVNARFAQNLPFFKRVSPELFVEIENLLDENYEEGNGPAPGRNLLVGLSVRF